MCSLTTCKLYPFPHKLLVSMPTLSSLDGWEMKWGEAKTRDPMPMMIIPTPIHVGLRAPSRPPKYVIGIRHTSDAMLYPPEISPELNERK